MASAVAPATPTPPAQALAHSRRPSLATRVLRGRLAPLGAVVCVLVALGAALAPWIAPYDPLKPDMGALLAAPSGAHLLGTDFLGRDILSRIIYGTRVSLAVGFLSVATALVVGTTVGVVGGYFGGLVDDVAMRLMDTILSFPALLLALAVAVVLGAGLTPVMIAIAVVSVPTFARLARAQVLSVRTYEFVSAAHSLGAGDTRIMLRHILPNIVAPLVVQASLSVAFAILTEASLSFLGLGVKPPEPSWGGMVNEGRQYLQQAPWVVFGPGAAIFIAVMGLSFLGDALRDALDVRM